METIRGVEVGALGEVMKETVDDDKFLSVS